MRYPFENCFEFQRNVHRYPLFTVLNIFSYTPLSCVDRNVRVCHWCTRCESGGYGGGLGLPRTGRTGLLRARPHSLSSQHRNYRNQSSVRRTFLPSGRLFDPAPTYTRFSIIVLRNSNRKLLILNQQRLVIRTASIFEFIIVCVGIIAS